ncbi:hypothetical protein H4R34_005245 [Dimargaris verticillata]|uniref:Uncharacterized protein n=1 Tax=Dimargaris verticillata TaxID=2761393 RepID=A0A9W8AZ74_9FUNG|nr:hypothetical protein H4R34_005245 [Dimargaris verticillata]
MTAIPSTYTADHGRSKRAHHPAKPYERHRRPAAPESDQASGLLSALKNLMSTPLRWINDGETSTVSDSHLPTHHAPGSQSNGANGTSTTAPANKLAASTRPPRPPISFKASSNFSTSKTQRLRNPGQPPQQAEGSGATDGSTSTTAPTTAQTSGMPNGVDSDLKSPLTNEPEALKTSDAAAAARKRQYSTRRNILQQYASDTEQANGTVPLAPSPEQSPKRQRRSQWMSEDESDYETNANLPFSPFAHNSRMVSAHTRRSHNPTGIPQVFRRGGSLPMRGHLFPRTSQLSLGRVGMNQSPFNAARILEALDSVSGLPAQDCRPFHARKPIPAFSRRKRATSTARGESESGLHQAAATDRAADTAAENRPATEATAKLSQAPARAEPDNSDQEPVSRSRRGSVSSRAPARKRTASITQQRHLPYSRPRKVSQGIRDKELERHHTIADKLSNLPTDESSEGGKQDKPGEGKRRVVSYSSKPARGSILKASTYTTRVHARARKNVRWKFSALVDDLSDDEDELEQLKNVPPLPLASNALTSSLFDSQPLVPAPAATNRPAAPAVGAFSMSSTTDATTSAASTVMPSVAFGMPVGTTAPTMPKVTAVPADIPTATTASESKPDATPTIPAFGNPPPVSQAFGFAAGSTTAPPAWSSFGTATSSVAPTSQSTATTTPATSAPFGFATSAASFKPMGTEPTTTSAPLFSFGPATSSSAPAPTQAKAESGPVSTNIFQLPAGSSTATTAPSAAPVSAPTAPASGFFNLKSAEPNPPAAVASTAPVAASAFAGFSFKPTTSTGNSAVTQADAAAQPPSFAFGSTVSQPATAANSTSTAAPTSLFGGSGAAEFTGFKAPSSQTATITTSASTNPLFSGKPADVASASATSVKPAFDAGSFAFGAPSATSQPNTLTTSTTTAPLAPTTSAVNPKLTDSSAASKPAFTFGSPTMPSFGASKPTVDPATTNASSTSFTFGATNASGTSSGNGSTVSVAKPTGFSFGASTNGLSAGFGQSKPPTASGFGFGASTSTTAKSPAIFNFGAPSQPLAASSTTGASSGASTGFAGFGASASSTTKPDMDDNDMSTDAMESTLAPVPNSSFGGTATAFGFNQPSGTAASSASTTGPLFSGFGQSTGATTPGFGGGTGGGFKANPTLGSNASSGTAPGSNGGGPSTTFTFGSNNAASATSSTFGSTGGGSAGTGGGFALQPSSTNAAAPLPSTVFGAAPAGGNQSRGSSPFAFGGGGATNPPGTPTGSVPTTPSSSFNRADTPPVQFAMGTAPQSPSTQGRKFARIRRRLNK